MGLPIIGGLLGQNNNQQPQQPSTVFNNPSISSPGPDASRMQYHSETERFEDDLAIIKAQLMGKEFQGYNRETLLPIFADIMNADGTSARPFCSAEGQGKMYAFAAGRLKPGTTLSNMVLERCYKLMMDDHRKLLALVYVNAFTWDIDVASWEAIHFSILDSIEMARRRSVDNQERDWITKIWNQITTMNASATQPANTGVAGLFRTGGVK